MRRGFGLRAGQLYSLIVREKVKEQMGPKMGLIRGWAAIAVFVSFAVLAQRWEITPPSVATFRDVPVGDTFFGEIETAYSHGIISGYSCGAGCFEFRPGNNATRGQIAKIVYLAVTGP